MPFESNNDSKTHPLYDNDPVYHYFNLYCENLYACDYYVEDTFNVKFNELSFPEKCFSMIHLNIRSIPKNLEHFEAFMSYLDIEFTVMAFSETWFNSSNDFMYNVDGYVRDDISIFNDVLETKFIEIDKDCVDADRNVIVGVIYRPPCGHVEDFTAQLGEILEQITKEKKVSYLLGDYNINLLNSERHVPTSDFLECMFSNEYIPLINKPKRDAGNSATLIDNIFMNTIPNESTLIGLFYTDITDHYPIFNIDRKKVSSDVPSRKQRVYNDRNVQKFVDCFAALDWSNVLDCTDPQDSYSYFHCQIST